MSTTQTSVMAARAAIGVAGDLARAQLETRSAGADGHDRLPQGDDDDQPVALGEVAGGEVPAGDAADPGRGVVEEQDHGPHDRLGGLPTLGEEHDVQDAHGEVGERDEDAVVAERAGHGQRGSSIAPMEANMARRTGV